MLVLTVIGVGQQATMWFQTSPYLSRLRHIANSYDGACTKDSNGIAICLINYLLLKDPIACSIINVSTGCSDDKFYTGKNSCLLKKSGPNASACPLTTSTPLASVDATCQSMVGASYYIHVGGKWHALYYYA